MAANQNAFAHVYENIGVDTPIPTKNGFAQVYENMGVAHTPTSKAFAHVYENVLNNNSDQESILLLGRT